MSTPSTRGWRAEATSIESAPSQTRELMIVTVEALCSVGAVARLELGEPSRAPHSNWQHAYGDKDRAAQFVASSLTSAALLRRAIWATGSNVRVRACTPGAPPLSVCWDLSNSAVGPCTVGIYFTSEREYSVWSAEGALLGAGTLNVFFETASGGLLVRTNNPMIGARYEVEASAVDLAVETLSTQLEAKISAPDGPAGARCVELTLTSFPAQLGATILKQLIFSYLAAQQGLTALPRASLPSAPPVLEEVDTTDEGGRRPMRPVQVALCSLAVALVAALITLASRAGPEARGATAAGEPSPVHGAPAAESRGEEVKRSTLDDGRKRDPGQGASPATAVMPHADRATSGSVSGAGANDGGETAEVEAPVAPPVAANAEAPALEGEVERSSGRARERSPARRSQRAAGPSARLPINPY